MSYPLLPVGEQNFAALRLSSMLYVDKTDLIYKIASKPRAYFLARPRRFGKSLLISTLHELFLHGVKPYANHDSYFKGLAIEKLWDDPKYYKVLHLNLRSINAQCQNAQEFAKNLEKVILDFTKDLGLKVKEGEYSASFRFQHLLDQIDLRSLVLLIDEYDAPLTAVLAKKFAKEQDKNAEYEAYALILRSLFGLIKDNSGKLRFALITGITYYKEAYLLTEGNSITDLSSTVSMSTICGYTKEEIRLFFNDYLIKSAALTFDLPQEKITLEHTEKILEKLTFWYDGYSFDEKTSKRVFSPWSILKFFDSDFPYFKPYWFESGGLPSILRVALIKGELDEIIEGINLNQDFLVSLSDFKNPGSLPYIDPKVLLYQTGYLTLKKSYVLQNGQYDKQIFLNYANQEIRFALENLLSDALFKNLKENLKDYNQESQRLKSALINFDLPLLVEIFNRMLRSIDYEGEPICKESTFTLILKMYLHDLLAIEATVNRHESLGRPDLAFNFENFSVIIENKFVHKATLAKLDRILDEALEQIKKRDYGNNLQNQTRLWRIALVYSQEKKAIVRFACLKD